VVPAVAGDDLLGANSVIWSTAVVSQIALAPLAGLLVATAGAGPAFGINAVSFLVSAAFLARIRIHRVPAPAGRRHLTDIRDGFAYLRASRLLTTLAAVQGVAALSAGATSALLVVLAERHLHLGAGRFGLLLAAIGVGAGAGPLLLRRLTRNVARPALLFGPYLLRGLVDLSLATFGSFAGALAGLAAYGIGTSTGNVTYNTTVQSVVADERRGRVFAFYDVVWQTGRLASIAAGGVLADTAGITAVYYLGGGLLLLAAALGLTRLRTTDLRPPGASQP
jgi:predicted MFS family arabinose efflux permease